MANHPGTDYENSKVTPSLSPHSSFKPATGILVLWLFSLDLERERERERGEGREREESHIACYHNNIIITCEAVLYKSLTISDGN